MTRSISQSRFGHVGPLTTTVVPNYSYRPALGGSIYGGVHGLNL